MLSLQIFSNLAVGTCRHGAATQVALFLRADSILKPFVVVLFLSEEVENT